MPASDSMTVLVVVRPLDLAMHEISVEMTLPTEVTNDGAVAMLPVWTPGSYLVRDYARFLDRMRLVDDTGFKHSVRKLDKHRWQIPTGGTLSYRLFCNDLTVRTNHVDAQQAHLLGAASFLGIEGRPELSYRIRFEGWPASWKIASALPSAENGFLAKDFDTLVDMPFALGEFHRFEWSERQSAFELVILGEHNGDEAKILDGVKRIVEICGGVFEGFPFERYVFLLVFSPGCGGGLEHRDSTTVMADPFSLAKPEGYHELFTLMAHEFFHVWNVKRLRASELGPFDYTKENPTRLLWFHEGFTSFMQYGLVLKAGLVPWTWVAKKLAKLWNEYTQRAGRLEQSLEEASFDAWIRHYKPTEFSPNSTVSYYEKGALVAWMMDARIRLASQGEQGLEQFFQQLWQRFGDACVTDEDLRNLYQELTGEASEAFWNSFLRGCEDLDSREITKAYGLRFEGVASGEAEENPGGHPGWSGITTAGDTALIRNVAPGSPAARAGLSYGQEILSVNGWRTPTAEDAQNRLAEHAAGTRLEVLAVNRGRVHAHIFELEENPFRPLRLQPAVLPSPLQREAFRAWTGQPYPLPLKGRS